RLSAWAGTARRALLLGLLAAVAAGCAGQDLQALADREDWQALADAAARRVERNPEDAEARLYGALAGYHLGQHEAALKALEALVDTDPALVRRHAAARH